MVMWRRRKQLTAIQTHVERLRTSNFSRQVVKEWNQLNQNKSIFFSVVISFQNNNEHCISLTFMSIILVWFSWFKHFTKTKMCPYIFGKGTFRFPFPIKFKQKKRKIKDKRKCEGIPTVPRALTELGLKNNDCLILVLISDHILQKMETQWGSFLIPYMIFIWKYLGHYNNINFESMYLFFHSGCSF